MRINGVKVFSATKFRDREEMSAKITRWLRDHSHLELIDHVVRQSSDNEFHCLSVLFFYHDPRVTG